MTSPIRALDSDIINSLLRIAPEREQELLNLKNEYEPTVLFFKEKGFSFSVDLIDNQIKLPTQSLEYLWCSSYLFYLIYRKYTECQQANELDQFDLMGDVELRSGMDLYNWSLDNLNLSDGIEWPNDLPRPAANRLQASEYESIADELFLCAIGWLLHHELAHISHQHPIKTNTLEESRAHETQADNSATTWILGNEDRPEQLLKRGMGIAVATLVLTTQDLLRGQFKETTHPRSFERLFSALDENFKDADHAVYSFSTIILQVHMALANHNIDLSEDIPWKELFEKCIIQLPRIKA